MANFWEKLNDLKKIPSPKEILEEQANYLNEATKGSVYALINELKSYDEFGFESESEDFNFEFVLKSKYATNYKFRLLEIKYPITFYPLLIKVNFAIGDEISPKAQQYCGEVELDSFDDSYIIYDIEDQNSLEEILKLIFNSNSTRNVLQALISLA